MRGILGHRHYQKVLLLVFGLVLTGPTALPIPSTSAARELDIYRRTAPAPTPTPTAKPTPAPSLAPVPRKATPTPSDAVLGAGSQSAFGIASGLASLPAAELSRKLADMKSLGVKWVRYDIEWSNIEYQGPGQYNWTDYDKAVQAVSASGLNSLIIIDYTPEWARKAACKDTPMCAPADPAAYAGFAAQVARRYSPYGVHYYEIWNEPNITTFYQPAANPGEYAAMLRAASAAIKSIDGRAFVLTAGTAPASTGGGNYSPVDFVNGIYAAGAKGSFDALGHHPYTWPYSPAYPNPSNAWGQLTTLHNIMVAKGDDAKQIWITEFGAPTGGPGSLASSGLTTSEGGADHVTEALEARMVADAVAAVRRLPWVGPFFWYSYQDAGTTSDTVENFFGLIRADGSHKPAYDAYKQAIAR